MNLISNRDTGGPPLVGFRQLPIQYIRSYVPYLEVDSHTD